MNALHCIRPGEALRAPAAMAGIEPHRPWWKVVVNTVLRALQPQPRKWVIYSRFEFAGATPRLVGYGFGRVFHRPRRKGGAR